MTFEPIARLVEEDKLKLIRRCIKKEDEGWECISPIKRIDLSKRNYLQRGQFYDYDGTTSTGFYQAIYQLKKENAK